MREVSDITLDSVIYNLHDKDMTIEKCQKSCQTGISGNQSLQYKCQVSTLFLPKSCLVGEWLVFDFDFWKINHLLISLFSFLSVSLLFFFFILPLPLFLLLKSFFFTTNTDGQDQNSYNNCKLFFDSAVEVLTKHYSGGEGAYVSDVNCDVTSNPM